MKYKRAISPRVFINHKQDCVLVWLFVSWFGIGVTLLCCCVVVRVTILSFTMILLCVVCCGEMVCVVCCVILYSNMEFVIRGAIRHDMIRSFKYCAALVLCATILLTIEC